MHRRIWRLAICAGGVVTVALYELVGGRLIMRPVEEPGWQARLPLKFTGGDNV